ncbi:hypothetical protein SLA2020_493530 [Shorea laevis]
MNNTHRRSPNKHSPEMSCVNNLSLWIGGGDSGEGTAEEEAECVGRRDRVCWKRTIEHDDQASTCVGNHTILDNKHVSAFFAFSERVFRLLIGGKQGGQFYTTCVERNVGRNWTAVMVSGPNAIADLFTVHFCLPASQSLITCLVGK